MNDISSVLDPYLTYVTPVFNAEPYVGEVIEAIGAQKSPNGLRYRHILVNDGSTDGSVHIMEAAVRADPGRVILINQVNSGEAAAVNAGVSTVVTPLLCVVNADDPLLPNHGAQLTETLLAAPEVVVAYPDWAMIDDRGNIVRVVRTKEFDRRSLIGDFVCLPGPGAVIRRSAIVGNLRNSEFRYVSDFEGWLRLSTAGSFRRVPSVVATWRQHEGGATSSGTGEAIAGEILRLAEVTLQDILPADVLLKFRRSALAHASYYAALHLNTAGRGGARTLMLRSIVLKPFPSVGYETDHRHLFGVVSVLLGPAGAVLLQHLSRLRRFLSNRASTWQRR